MKLKIEISLDNDAFQGYGLIKEIEQIAINISQSIAEERYVGDSDVCMDMNGNTVGNWKIVK